MSAGPIALLLAGGGEGAHTFLGLPYPFWQTLNLLAFLGLLVWLLRKPLVQFFQNRRTQVADALTKAEADRDRAEAIRTAVMLSRPGDIILVAGKGHETYQIVGDVKHPFDDREEIKKRFALLN